MAVIKIIIRVADVLSATIVSVASLTALSTNTAGANGMIDVPSTKFQPSDMQQKKRRTFVLLFVPPQVVLVMRCVPTQPDFKPMV